MPMLMTWGFAAKCHFQLLERQVYSMARLCPDQSFLVLCHRRRVAGLSMLYRVNSTRITLFSGLPSAVTVRHTLDWSLKYQRVERPNSQGVSCRPRFECGMIFPTMFDTDTLDGFKGAVNRWLLP